MLQLDILLRRSMELEAGCSIVDLVKMFNLSRNVVYCRKSRVKYHLGDPSLYSFAENERNSLELSQPDPLDGSLLEIR